MKTKFCLRLSTTVLLLGFVFLTGCVSKPLSSWNDSAPAKTALLGYMKSVTNKGSADYIPVEKRIAVFDFDGTLFLETDPTYFDWLLFEHRVLEDANFTPTEAQRTAANAAREGHFPKLDNNRERMVSEAYRGLTLEAFDAFIRQFMEKEQPGFTNLKRGDAYYKPMVEVVEYLVKNKFTVYVISGTDRLTVRPLTEKLHLPPRQVIGSDSTILASNQGDKDGLDYTFSKGDVLVLGGQNLVKDLQMNKTSAIAREIGEQPVLAFGNALSDASMLNYAILGNKYKALAFMLLCDDTQREYGNSEKAEKILRASQENNWIPVSMRDDWKTIYGEHVTKRADKHRPVK
ncbi:MAG: haloacid dehalogenase-like hydrolase [Victivallales bacterium]|nr:haloacid dehalogenase-like hydrolase [Victivallales bacterium]